jgi:hypothetical protein
MAAATAFVAKHIRTLLRREAGAKGVSDSGVDLLREALEQTLLLTQSTFSCRTKNMLVVRCSFTPTQSDFIQENAPLWAYKSPGSGQGFGLYVIV